MVVEERTYVGHGWLRWSAEGGGGGVEGGGQEGSLLLVGRRRGQKVGKVAGLEVCLICAAKHLDDGDEIGVRRGKGHGVGTGWTKKGRV